MKQQIAVNTQGEGGGMKIVGGIIALLLLLGAGYFIYQKVLVVSAPAKAGSGAGGTTGAPGSGGSSDPLSELEASILNPTTTDSASNLDQLGNPINTGTDKVVVWDSCGWSGNSASFGVGSYNDAALNAAGIKKNAIQSVQVPVGYRVTFYRNDDLTGANMATTTNILCLGGKLLQKRGFPYKDIYWNTSVSSLKVEQVAS